MGTRTALIAGLLVGTVLGSPMTAAAAQERPADSLALAPVERTVGSERPRGYQYPYDDPYLATMTIAVLNANGLTPGLKRHVVHVPVLPGRNDLPSLEGRGEVSVALYRQDRPAPLMFLLSGIGSNPYFGLGTYFASLFYHEGFHVVILPSPMSWNFALAASRSGAPGYAPADARDLYEVMQRTLGVLKSQYRLQITGIDFMGASLGALEGAYLSVIDADQGKIGIERLLLVNPPLDIAAAMKTLDGWAALSDTFGAERSALLQGKALAIIESASTVTGDPMAIDRAAKQFAAFSTEELQFLIAQYAQTMLPELVYVTQAIHDRNVLTAERAQVRQRLQEAKGFTLAEYSEKIALPSWTRASAELATDPESASRRGSLLTIVDRLRGNPRVLIMHNADDILADRASIAELKEAMGEQMIVYPVGGHLGNLWFSDNKQSILRFFRGSPGLRAPAGQD
jgi:hypothetical protein